MEYHQDRFDDYSLMIYKNNKLVSIFPANRIEGTVISHQGLSYGGLLLLQDVKFETTVTIFQALLQYLLNNAIPILKIKVLPKIYNSLPSDEIDYLLFKSKAHLYRRDVSMVVDNGNKLKLSSNRSRNLKKAKNNNVVVKEVLEFDDFFNQILIPNLEKRHNSLPTHSLKEISELKLNFPNKIRQFNAYQNNEIIAGVTIFESSKVAHAQYISTITSKNELGGLDAIFDFLINKLYSNKHYFSFGISNENQGQQVNRGLLNWKESFGANAITHDFYTINTENYRLLDDVML
ncbi:GNAT family N-acetyltransferase [Psychroserpens burtonensis]|nr:GNAT family N-acetyltransferase [Psychroserpens burtonensis]